MARIAERPQLCSEIGGCVDGSRQYPRRMPPLCGEAGEFSGHRRYALHDLHSVLWAVIAHHAAAFYYVHRLSTAAL